MRLKKFKFNTELFSLVNMIECLVLLSIYSYHVANDLISTNNSYYVIAVSCIFIAMMTFVYKKDMVDGYMFTLCCCSAASCVIYSAFSDEVTIYTLMFLSAMCPCITLTMGNIVFNFAITGLYSVYTIYVIWDLLTSGRIYSYSIWERECVAYLVLVIFIFSFVIKKIVLTLSDYIVQYQKVCYTDALTGCYNRLYWEYLVKNPDLIIKDNVTVLLIDIDDFKSINDTYGHLAGDNALRFVVEGIYKSAPNQEVDIIRVGGDEFMVIVPTSKKEWIIECILNWFKLYACAAVDGNCIHVTIGSIDYDITEDTDLSGVYSDVDKSLYENKTFKERKI